MSVAFTANNTFYITGSFADTFKGGAISFASSAIFSGIGAANFSDNFWGHIGRSLAHGVAGGVLAELQGGEFRHGFVSAAATKLMDVNGMSKWLGMGSADYNGLRVLTGALIGGAISEHTGGKFANGAATAAIAQIYNGNSQLAEELAQEGNPVHDPKSGPYEVEVPDDVKTALSITLGVDESAVGNVKVIANSRWANF